jgi:hypothetical protein
MLPTLSTPRQVSFHGIELCITHETALNNWKSGSREFKARFQNQNVSDLIGKTIYAGYRRNATESVSPGHLKRCHGQRESTSAPGLDDL